MADIDTGWFAELAAGSRPFGHSGKVFNII
jgi:hypothetical protein